MTFNKEQFESDKINLKEIAKAKGQSIIRDVDSLTQRFAARIYYSALMNELEPELNKRGIYISFIKPEG
jgi:hypothetical protein